MVGRYFNPFGKYDVFRPATQNTIYETRCQGTDTSKKLGIDLAPFPRMVDLWFLGLCIATREGKDPKDLSKEKTSKITDGTIFDSDPGRMQIIMLVVIDIEKDVRIVGEPGKMMRIANGLAAAGVPLIDDILKERQQDNPIWNLTAALDKMLRE